MSLREVNWDTMPFRLYLIPTPRDGNCLFHAICNAFYLPYRVESSSTGERMTRAEIVSQFRCELASLLDSRCEASSIRVAGTRSGHCDTPIGTRDPSIGPSGVSPGYCDTYYTTLGGGSIKEMGDSGMKEYTLEGLKSWLRSSSPMGEEVVSYICQLIHKDLYFLDTRTRNIYITPSSATGSVPVPSRLNNSIVIFYNGNHYDLAGIMEEDGSLSTIFDPDDEFIQHIRACLDMHRSSN
jgi:hypothetical protein